jgi:hypothetical protein
VQSVNDLNIQFSKEIQMANKYMKKMFITLTIREIHVKATLRYHFTPVRMTIIKKKITNADKGKGEK